MADDPLTDCMNCETDKSLRKVLNSVGIVFKGSGFYVTDNRGKKNGSSPSANGKSSDSDTAAKPESTTKEDGGKAEKKADASSSNSKKAKTAV